MLLLFIYSLLYNSLGLWSAGYTLRFRHVYFLSVQTLMSLFLLLLWNSVSAEVVYLVVKHSSYQLLKRHFFSLLCWPLLQLQNDATTLWKDNNKWTKTGIVFLGFLKQFLKWLKVKLNHISHVNSVTPTNHPHPLHNVCIKQTEKKKEMRESDGK